jgi:hypothetical protein
MKRLMAVWARLRFAVQEMPVQIMAGTVAMHVQIMAGADHGRYCRTFTTPTSLLPVEGYGEFLDGE